MMSRKPMMLLFAAAMVVLDGACSTSPATAGTSFETENTIAGIAVDSSGRPIPSARVSLRPYWYVRNGLQADTSMIVGIAEAVTDSQGRFSLVGMPLGSYCVEIQSEEISVVRSESLDDSRRRVFLGAVSVRSPSKVSGGVKIPSGTGPVKIQVYGTEIQGTSDANGHFQLAKVPSGQIRMRAVSPRTGLVVGEAPIAVLSGTTIAADTLKFGSEDRRTWRYGRNLSIDPVSAGLAGNGVVLDLPVLLRLDQAMFPAQGASDGSDLRFFDLSGKPIPFEIAYWDSASASGRVWIHLDSLATNGPTRAFQMLWGRSGSASASNSKTVFDSAAGWSGVWHLGNTIQDNQGRLVSPDATANGQDGLIRGSGVTGDGVVGRGLRFNGTTDLVRIGGSSTELGRRGFTMEMWARPDRVGATFLSKGILFTEPGMKEIGLRVSIPGVHSAGWYPSLSTFGSYAHYSVGQSPFKLGQWSHLTLRWTVVKPDTGKVDWFLDGKPIGGTARIGLTPDALGDSLSLGRDVSGAVDSLRMKGAMDEVRILGQTRSNAWIWMSHVAQAPGSTLVKFLDRW